MRLRDGGLRAVLDCPALASRIRGDAEQSAVVEGWAELLNRLTHPLFDTDRSRRHIEAAFDVMWRIHQRGEVPRAFAVAPIAD